MPAWEWISGFRSRELAIEGFGDDAAQSGRDIDVVFFTQPRQPLLQFGIDAALDVFIALHYMTWYGFPLEAAEWTLLSAWICWRRRRAGGEPPPRILAALESADRGWGESLFRRRCPMPGKHVVCVLVVAGLMGSLSPRLMAQGFSWWRYESVIEEVQDRGVLRVGLGLFAPWSACDADGELIGFEIEVATRLAEDMGVEVAFARTNWSYIIPALIAEEFDVIISGMTILPKRSLKVNFTSSYNQTGIFLVANTDRTAGLETLEDFNRSSVTIASRRGSSSISAIENVFPDAMILLYDSDTEILESVVSGMADAARAYGLTGRTWVADNPDTLRLPFEEPFASEVLAIAVRKGDHDALNFFNSWIAVRKADGWLEQRRQYWFDTRDWEDRVAADPGTIAECEASFQ